MISFRSYEAMIGVVTHDYFDDISDADVRRGVPTERRDRMLQTFVRNHYSAHLREILLTLQNEYTDWTEYGESPAKVKEQVRNILLSRVSVVQCSARR